MIERTKDDGEGMFMPTKSRVWPALVQADAAMKKARGETT